MKIPILSRIGIVWIDKYMIYVEREKIFLLDKSNRITINTIGYRG